MAWSKTLPADNSKFGVSPGYLRTNWDALEDTIGTDHYYMGQTNDGKHKYCSFVEQSSAPTTAASVGAVYTKDSGTQPELFYREESNGDEVQITTNGVLNATTLVAASGTDLAITAASGQDILVTMGDNAAANKVSFLDSDSSEVAYIDSDGDASFDGDVAIGNDLNVTNDVTVGNDLTVTGDIAVTGDITVGGTNVLPVAYGYVVSGVLSTAYNVASLSPSGNTIRATFTSALANTTYTVVVSENNSTNPRITSVSSRATTYVDFKATVWDAGSKTFGDSSPSTFSFVIFGG